MFCCLGQHREGKLCHKFLILVSFSLAAGDLLHLHLLGSSRLSHCSFSCCPVTGPSLALGLSLNICGIGIYANGFGVSPVQCKEQVSAAFSPPLCNSIFTSSIVRHFSSHRYQEQCWHQLSIPQGHSVQGKVNSTDQLKTTHPSSTNLESKAKVGNQGK